MANLVKNGAFIDDQWTRIEDDAAVSDYSIISLERFNNEGEALAEKINQGLIGLQLNSDQTADLIAEKSQAFALICIDFPKFADGRGYSAARLLRERYGYQGELRAVGDVLIDQLFFMQRCGFDAMALRDDQDKDDAITALGTFSVTYQNDVHDQRPLFRRR